MNRVVRVALVALLCSPLVGACSKKQESEINARPSNADSGVTAKAPPQAATAEKAPSGEPLGAPSWEVDAAPGITYFAIDGVGVVGLEAGEFFTAITNTFLTKDLHLGGDGAVYASLIGGGTYKIVGRNAVKLSATYYDQIAASSDGDVWAGDLRNLYHYDGTAWTTTERATWGDQDILGDLAFDTAGTLFVASSERMRLKPRDADWTLADYRAVLATRPFFHAVTPTPDGAVYVSHVNGVFRWKDGKATAIRTAGRWFGANLQMLPTGWLASGSGSTLTMIGPGDASIDADAEMLGFDPKAFSAIAGDGQGRVWLATDAGVAIVGPGAKLIQHWKPGTVAAITGRVSKMVITKGGPKLPVVGPVQQGTVVGKALWDDGQPIAGTSIQMCERPRMMFKNTPCADAAFGLTAQTGADGSFRFEHVPVWQYGFSIKATDTWSITSGSMTCCAKLTNNGTIDLGSLVLRRGKAGK